MNKRVLITGGAGFIGINVADYFLNKNYEVVLLDNLSRKGADSNLKWLRTRKKKFRFVKADVVSDSKILAREFQKVDAVIHLAAQVAVTTSVENPVDDFNVNALGTLRVLEAIRLSSNKPMLIYASTNKVYGEIEGEPVVLTRGGYRYKNIAKGISEDRVLNFHSPYGCSKGAADQYVRDYSRIYNLNTVVFRQSCIYGPHQFGMADQGWVAWFAIAASLNKPITIFGDGHQARDLLFVGDLCSLYHMAISNPDKVGGNIYNIGGGTKNVFSVLQTVASLSTKLGTPINPTFSQWRPGDQKIYVSDIKNITKDLGWKPETTFSKGLDILVSWVKSEQKTLASLDKTKI